MSSIGIFVSGKPKSETWWQKRKEERENQEKLDRLRKEKEDTGQVSLFVSEDKDFNPIQDDYGEEE